MTAPSVGEEWARRWTVVKSFSDFQTLDACVRALYPEACETLPLIPKRRFSLGGFTDLSMMEGLGGTLSGKIAAANLTSVGGGNGSSDSSGQRLRAADKTDKAIEERSKLLCGWSLCALSLAVPGGDLSDCDQIKEFFGPDEVDEARLQQQQQQQHMRGSGHAAVGNATASTSDSGGTRRGSIGEALSASFSRLGSFRRSSSASAASEDELRDGLLPAGAGNGGACGHQHAADERRGSIGDRAMAALGAGMSVLRGGGMRASSAVPGVVGVAAVEEWAVVGVALRARHNTALTAECDAPCIPGTTIPAPAVATGELQAGDDAGPVLEVRYSSNTDGGSNGGQLRVKLEGGWASVIAKDGTQLLEPQPRI